MKKQKSKHRYSLKTKEINSSPLIIPLPKRKGERGSRGLHGPDFSGPDVARLAWLQSRPCPARSKNKDFSPGPVRPAREIEIPARVRPGLK